MGPDKQLLLMKPQAADLVGLTLFYQSVLEAWTVFTSSWYITRGVANGGTSFHERFSSC